VLAVKVARIVTVLFLAFAASLPSVCADNGKKPTDARYYPLSVGSTWTYEVRRFFPTAKSSSVKWTVTHASVEHGRTVYQVWPKPMQSDDEALQLAVTPEGIIETTDATLILRFPVRTGDTWAQTPPGSHPRNFYVRSANRPCRVHDEQIAACVVIEEGDSGTGLKTVTTYASGIGPVRYEYFKRVAGRDTLLQRVELITHSIAAR
jgi:hypothetical protein